MNEEQLPPLSPIVRTLSRRQSMRVATSMPVSLVMKNYPAPVLVARAVDMGVAGTCVQTESLLDGSAVTAIRVSFDDKALELPVALKWQSEGLPAQGPLAGFEFTEVSAADEFALWDFVQHRGRRLATFIRSCVGLEALGFEDAFNLALTTRLRQVPVGRAVYQPNDPSSSANSIFALMHGGVVLEEIEEGGTRHPLGTVKVGDVFGGMAVVAGCEALESAFATAESRVLEFPTYSVEHLIATKPHLGIVLLRATAYQLIARLRDRSRGTDTR